MTHVEPPRESALKAWVRALERTASIARQPRATFPVRIAELGEVHGDRTALIGERERFTYRELAARTNRYARWAVEQGITKGDVVCLLMHNSPDYLAAWVGVTRVGAVAALVNTNLVGDSLAHAIQVASPGHVIVGADLVDAVLPVRDRLGRGVHCWVQGGEDSRLDSLNDALARSSDAPVTEDERALPLIADRALYIYTSGTTGLPKAAQVSHHRVLQWSYWFAGLLNAGEGDRMYNCLPMYHSVGGIVAVGAPLVAGGSVVVRKKFSARAFWDDVVQNECTLFQYIGELCRFLINAPPHPQERAHHIRVACGNGLRGDVWETFQSRFGIPRILEFYAATEANFSLYNCEGKPGAIGRIPPFLSHRFPVTLVAFDVETGEPARDEHGRCRRCAPNEVGEAINAIVSDGTSPESEFAGYTDRAATERKVLRNVFAEHDAWFRSGDLMRQDAAGFFYFVDRVGDTFRWKGENVSTNEVEEAAAAGPSVHEVVVYGVSVPGNEGRVGMAAIVPRPDFDLAAFNRHISTRLPDYARPVFLRLINDLETTGTFKPKKQDLVRDGYDPAVCDNSVFMLDRHADRYVLLDQDVYDRIRAGSVRL